MTVAESRVAKCETDTTGQIVGKVRDTVTLEFL